MKNTLQRVGLWSALVGGCLLQGCLMVPTIDPDLGVRAGLSIVSDFAVFLLENLAASL